MNGELLRRTVIVSNSQGLHMRPITTFVEAAAKFQSTINGWKNGEKFNGKSPLSLLGLGAEKGTELTIEADGPDAATALQALADLLNKLASEEDTPPPAAPDEKR